MKTVKASYALLSAVGSFMTGLRGTTRLAGLALVFVAAGAQATIWEADGQTAANYQSATGTWETASVWSTNGTLLSTWPGLTTDDARLGYSQQNQNFLLTIDSSVTVNSLNIAAQNGTKATITNGTLHIGAGGITVAGNQNGVDSEAIWSSIVLDANQTWSTAQNLWVRGDISGNASLTQVGGNPLNLYSGASSYTGGTRIMGGSAGIVKYLGTTSGTPLGTGGLSFNNGSSTNNSYLYLTPGGSGSVIALTGGSDGGNQIAFDGYARIYISKGSQTSVTYTFGNAADTGSVFVRNNKGTLAIGNSTSVNPGVIGDANGKFLVANGATGVPIQNGMVDAYITTETMGSQWAFDFLKYDAVNGLANLTYDGTFSGTSSGIQDSTKKYKVINSSFPILTNNTAVYALSLQQTSTLTLSNNAVLSIGNGVQPAGLIVHNGPIRNAGDSPASKIDFGTSEGIIYNGQNAFIATPIAGSAGVTFNAGGGNTIAITLSAANTYTGPTTILCSGVTLTNGGSLVAGSPVTVYNGGVLNINSGGTVNGVITNNGTLTLNSGGTVTGSITINNGGAATINGGATSVDILVKGTLTLAGSTPLNVGPITGVEGAGTLTQNNTYTTDNGISLNFPNNSSLGTFNAAASTKTTLSNGGGTTSFANFAKNLNSANITIDGGTWNISSMSQNNTGAQFGGTLNVINGATFNLAGPRYSGHGTWNAGGMGAGTINIGTGWSVENPAINYPFAYNALSGGTINFASGVTLATGANTVPTTTSMSVTTGGVISVTGNLTVGGTTAQGAGGTLANTLSVAGGKLIVNGTLSQAAPLAAVVNNFIWSAGQITAATITTANLPGGILANSAGTLEPGDIGVPGKTTITGSYTESSANAVLAIDIGGVKQGDAFTNAPGYYDTLSVSATSTVTGRLDINLINGYIPQATNKFTILTSTTALSGGFANVFADGTTNRVWCADGYSRFDVLFNTTAKTVILTNYAVNVWSGAPGGAWTTGANWTLAEANGSDMAAYFGAGPSGSVTLDTARTLRGLTFDNSASYAIAGSGGSLTLQGDALTSPKMTVLAGSHTISVPLALSNATEIAVAASSMLTLAGNVTGGQNVTKTGAGTLALGGVNTLGALTVSAGIVKQTAGTTTLSGLTLAGGTYDLWAGTLRIAVGGPGGAIDTITEVETAITDGKITGRGQTVPVSSFKISIVDGYVKVELKMRGTLISLQ